MGGEKHLNNNGFSLIELIVAVMIMGIIAGGAILGLSSVFNARSERAANVSASILKRARQKALAMDDTTSVYAEFKFDSGEYTGLVYYGTDEVAREKMGNDNLVFTFKNHSGSGDISTVSDTNSIRVYFKKSTGGIEKIEKIGTGTAETIDVDKLEITGSGDSQSIILGSITGRCYIEKEVGG